MASEYRQTLLKIMPVSRVGLVVWLYSDRGYLVMRAAAVLLNIDLYI